jgi:nucleoside-diphosphate-sugar epimerase
MSKIIVTGGSGFIGTNMINLLIKNKHHVINYDIAEPRCKEQYKFWTKINLLDREDLFLLLERDKPDYIIHLAARTDLNENTNIEEYSVNIQGVRNIMDGAARLNSLRRIVVASSMLVCKLGYIPKSFDDYAPNSLYGESKVLTEKIVKEFTFDWIIVRPTSIWGPWFGEPYKNFFDLVIKGFYFNIPSKYASTKTYGFVENICLQIYSLMISKVGNVKHNYFYLGDSTSINITDWAHRIRILNSQSQLITLPKFVLKLAAHIGDFLHQKLGITKFPMNTFRYKNMTTDNIVNDLSRTLDVTQAGVNTNLDEEINKTLNWIKHKI